jgi:hypothetical protein
MEKESYRTISFHARQPMLDEIKSRFSGEESLGSIAARDLARYYSILPFLGQEMTILGSEDKEQLTKHLKEIARASKKPDLFLKELGATSGITASSLAAGMTGSVAGLTAGGLGAGVAGAAGLGILTVLSGGFAAVIPLALPLLFRGATRRAKGAALETKGIIKKLESLSYPQRVALVDELERRALESRNANDGPE